jgi:hypothetical protein
MALTKRDIEVIDLIDKVIQLCPEHSVFYIGNIIEEELNLPDKKYLANEVRSGMYNLGYIDIMQVVALISNVTLSDLGKEVKRLGGHYNYIKWIENEERKEQVKYEAEVRNLESSTRLNDWLYKTKWLPLILSIIALIVSLLALTK